MGKDYKVSSDGTIFEIKEDGSIAKLARIDDKGNIITIGEENLAPKSSGGKGVWFFMIVFAIAAVVLGIKYYDANLDYQYTYRQYTDYKDMYNNISSNLLSMEEERNKAQNELSTFKNNVSSTYPIIITDIEIGNVNYEGDIETDYGYSIYSYNTMYLKPRIKYTGLITGTKTFKIKWYNINGTLKQGLSSPSGYSFSDDIYISNGTNTFTLSGWGNSSKGNWSSGMYRIEVWYGDVCLKSKIVTIY